MSDVIDLGPAAPLFPTATVVADAIRAAADAGRFRYTRPGKPYLEAAAAWQQRRHGWDVSADDALFLPKTTHLIGAILNAGPTFTREVDDTPTGMPVPQDPQDMAMIAQLIASQSKEKDVEPRPPVVVALSPTYGRVAAMIRASGAELRMVRMEDFGGRLRINWPALENAMIGADYLHWINPHNPSGRVWSEEELKRVGYLAELYHVTVISDDIHADFTTSARPYLPMAKACPFLFETGKLIQTSSPTITFSMSGIEAAVVFAKGDARVLVEDVKSKLSLSTAGAFSEAAGIAAWESGDAWADEIAELCAANQRLAASYLSEHVPALTVAESDDSCLLWFNANSLVDSDDDLLERTRAHGVSVTPGGQFGESWTGWVRLNLAMPDDRLAEGLKRLAAALQ